MTCIIQADALWMLLNYYDFGCFKADVDSLKKLKKECEEHKVCTNFGVAVSDDLGIEYMR